MAVTKKHSDLEEIISYTPPQLYVGKEWYIGFMAFDPALNGLHRKRIKLNHISGIMARRKYANDLIKRLNEKLQIGWNPWIEAENRNSCVTLKEVSDRFRTHAAKMLKDGLYRECTFTTYMSYLRVVEVGIRMKIRIRLLIFISLIRFSVTGSWKICMWGGIIRPRQGTIIFLFYRRFQNGVFKSHILKRILQKEFHHLEFGVSRNYVL